MRDEGLNGLIGVPSRQPATPVTSRVALPLAGYVMTTESTPQPAAQPALAAAEGAPELAAAAPSPLMRHSLDAPRQSLSAW
jgi:hypothetical protein